MKPAPTVNFQIISMLSPFFLDMPEKRCKILRGGKHTLILTLFSLGERPAGGRKGPSEPLIRPAALFLRPARLVAGYIKASPGAHQATGARARPGFPSKTGGPDAARLFFFRSRALHRPRGASRPSLAGSARMQESRRPGPDGHATRRGTSAPPRRLGGH
jgi:hypothetical protein